MNRLVVAAVLVVPSQPSADPKTTLPTVPSFEVAAAEPGFESVRSLRVNGSKLLDTEVKVRGYVNWIYDCATALQKPGVTRTQIEKRIDADPTLCERKKLYLADTKTAPRTATIWVVDVPRPPNKLEQARLPKGELANWPTVPKLFVGDYVTITGTWKIRSPHDETNSDGLLVYASYAKTKPKPPRKATKPSAAATPALPPIARKTPKPVDEPVRQKSAGALVDCTKARGLQQYDAAIAACTLAVTTWDGNDSAWYQLGMAAFDKHDWRAAAGAFAHAVELVPDRASYHLMHGRALYEDAIFDARHAQAKKAGRKDDEITPDLSAVNFDKALEAVLRAKQLDKTDWHVHYLVGAIHRNRNEPKLAADALTAALALHPPEPAPYVALAELYRRWDYTAQAIAVARYGTANVTGRDAADVWFALGVASDDNQSTADAIAAYGKALELRPDHEGAKFMRGQTYFRAKDYAKARLDLEEIAQSGHDAFAKQQAQRMLADVLASKKP